MSNNNNQLIGEFNEEDYNYDYLFKIVLIGDSGVGKSNILSVFTRNEFSLQTTSTIGVQFAIRYLNMEDKIIKLQIWDTAGQERYRAITSAYYKGAVGIMFIYDITKNSTFQNIEKWLQEAQEYIDENTIMLLMGNKADLEKLRQIDAEMASEYAYKNNMGFIETSALTNQNINQAFQKIAAIIYKQIMSTQLLSFQKFQSSIKKESQINQQFLDDSKIKLSLHQNKNQQQDKKFERNQQKCSC